MRSLPCLLFPLLLACGEKDEVGTTDDSEVEGDADTDSDADTDTDTDTDAVPTDANLSGTITTTAGDPLEGVRVQMCKQLCRTAMTNSAGEYVFPPLEGFTHSFEVVVLEDGWPTPLVPLTLVAESDTTLDAQVPQFTDEVSMPTSSKKVTVDSLSLTLSLEQLDLPFGADDSAVRAVRVPEQAWLPVERDGTLLAMWYLGPFDAVADPPVSYSIANDLGLPAGALVKAWVADYIAAEWVSAGTMTVSDDGTTLVNDGTGLPVLSTLVLMQE